MKPFLSPALLLLASLVTLTSGCKSKKDETPQPVSHSYAGVLSLEYTKGFPQFSAIVKSDVTVAQDHTVTFGAGDSENFDKEDIKYDNGKPVTKVHMSGTLAFHEAKGEYHEISGKEYLWIWVHTSINGQMTVWGWDNDAGWILALDTPYTYEDTYSDGQMQFLIDDAVLTGASVKKTLPDLEGTFTYGYTLQLVVGLP